LKIYGDGKLNEQLKNYIIQKNLTNSVIMMGRKDLVELEDAYKKAHFVILLSESEGWPKVLAEGMWYGAIPVSSAVSCIPWMLGNGERGILIDDDKNSFTNNLEKIKFLLMDPESLENMSQNSMNWAQEFTLERFERDIKEFL
jgi:glycosyltransferase involved in cell wall biosynthesis